MATATLPTWATIAADADRHREHVLEELRQWGAALHVARRAPGVPSRWVAALDAAGHPVRSQLVSVDATATDRDRADAAAADLWDAVAVAWGLVRWIAIARLDRCPAVEHVVAELHAAGRWLALYPVSVAAHDLAVAALFAPDAEAPSCSR